MDRFSLFLGLFLLCLSVASFFAIGEVKDDMESFVSEDVLCYDRYGNVIKDVVCESQPVDDIIGLYYLCMVLAGVGGILSILVGMFEK